MKLAAEAAAKLGRPLDETQLWQLERYRALMLEWNKRINLTAIEDPDAFERLHFVDSIAGLEALPEAEGTKVIDVGSGAGLPGLAMKIARPDLAMTLLDATRKRTTFIETVVGELGLEGVEVLNARAEDVGRDRTRRESWDVALARALAPLPVLVELCLPLVRVGGLVVAWKKRDVQDEIIVSGRPISILGGRRMKGLPVELPGLPDDRQLLRVEKIKETPAKYPRLPGVPKQKPLV